MDYTVIDFHTHPFLCEEENICSHKTFCNMTAESTVSLMKELGVSRICGSVIKRGEHTWKLMREQNDSALRLRDLYGDFYIPGFHVHPDFPEESCREIQRMAGLGVKLIGELVPYYHGWKDYACENFSLILDEAEKYGMVVSFHSMGEDEMDRMVRRHPDTVFVAAHPGEYGEFCRHMERMKLSRNYYLDLSGYGIFRHGMLRHAIDLFGAERFLYGSDYPTCNPAMYLGGVALDPLITEAEKNAILHRNVEKLLGL